MSFISNVRGGTAEFFDHKYEHLKVPVAFNYYFAEIIKNQINYWNVFTSIYQPTNAHMISYKTL